MCFELFFSSLVVFITLYMTMVCFQAGDDIYRAGRGRWKRHGRCSTGLLEDTELASSLGCPGCSLSARVDDTEESGSSHNCEIVWRYNFWLVSFVGFWTFEFRCSGTIKQNVNLRDHENFGCFGFGVLLWDGIIFCPLMIPHHFFIFWVEYNHCINLHFLQVDIIGNLEYTLPISISTHNNYGNTV